MSIFKNLNELYCQCIVNPETAVYAKVGTMIAHSGGIKSEKLLLGPNGDKNPFEALGQQVLRKITGENLPLMVFRAQRESQLILADNQRHVLVLELKKGQQLLVDSNNLLAFDNLCTYRNKAVLQGALSQKGLFVSVLTANEDTSVAISSEGNPLVLETPCVADPDSVVCWCGDNPAIQLDISWKNFIGQSSGEAYYFEWGRSGSYVVVQATERTSGITLRGGEALEFNNINPKDAVHSISTVSSKISNIAETVEKHM